MSLRFKISIFFFFVFMGQLVVSNEQAIHSEIGEGFGSIQVHAGDRWQRFQRNREFKLFEARKSDAQLEEEFKEIHRVRQHMWTTEGYERAMNLISGDLVRAPWLRSFCL